MTDFRTSPSINSARQAQKVAGAISRRIMDTLGQSKKFALIDRQYLKLTKAELKLIRGADFKLEELARLGNQVGTDYLIVGTLLAADESLKTMKMKTTGKVFRSKISDVRVSVRVIDVATSRIAYAGEPSFSGEHPIETAIDYVSKVVGAGIVNTFHPNLMPLPKQPESKKTSVRQVETFGNNALKKLKEESKNDW